MTLYLANSLSLNMLEIGAAGIRVDIQPVFAADIPADSVSVIGHADMAAILSGILRREVEVDRGTVTLKEGDVLFVAQYHGPRLPAGATELPVGARIEFYRVIILQK